MTHPNSSASKKQERVTKCDIFISHSWKDKGLATTIAQELEYLHCGKVWIDYENIGGGEMLDKSIRSGLRNVRHVIVLWSNNASTSRWVAQEIRLAAAMHRNILPCVFDNTRLETNKNLAGRLYCDFRISFDCGLSELVGYLYDDDAITSQFTKNRQKTMKSYENLFKQNSDASLARCIHHALITQGKIIDAIEAGNAREAMTLQANLDITIDHLLRLCPEHPDILALAGDQRKNEYQIRRLRLWKESSDDYSEQKALDHYGNLLEMAEKYFFRSLSVEPGNPGALNGIGTICVLPEIPRWGNTGNCVRSRPFEGKECDTMLLLTMLKV